MLQDHASVITPTSGLCCGCCVMGLISQITDRAVTEQEIVHWPKPAEKTNYRMTPKFTGLLWVIYLCLNMIVWLVYTPPPPPPPLSLSLVLSLPPSLWYDNLQSFVYRSWNGFTVWVQAPFVLCSTLFGRLEASTENVLDQNQKIRSANLNGRNCPAMTALFQLPPPSVSLQRPRRADSKNRAAVGAI